MPGETVKYGDNGTHCDSPHTFGVWGVNSWVTLASDDSRLPCDVSATCKDWSAGGIFSHYHDLIQMKIFIQIYKEIRILIGTSNA